MNEWALFFLRYLIAAAIGLLAVIFGARLVNERYEVIAVQSESCEVPQPEPDAARVEERHVAVTYRNNPHRASYAAARAEYAAFVNESRTMHAQFQSATGSERMQLADRLRLRKQEEYEVRRKLESTKQMFDEWNRANPEDAANADRAALRNTDH